MDRLIARQRLNIGLLPVDIASITAIRLNLRTQGDRNLIQLRPDGGKPVNRHVLQRQKVGNGAARAVTRHRKTVGAQLTRKCSNIGNQCLSGA